MEEIQVVSLHLNDHVQFLISNHNTLFDWNYWLLSSTVQKTDAYQYEDATGSISVKDNWFPEKLNKEFGENMKKEIKHDQCIWWRMIK
jgi:hypothetical protein